MVRKRPCRICRRWFQPHARAGDRQRVCSTESCQRARHRRADNAWHARRPDYDKKRRLREAAKLPSEGQSQAEEDPLDAVDWAAIERAVGAKPRAVIEGVGRLLVRFAQDAVRATTPEEPPESNQQLNRCSQDAVPTIHPIDTTFSTQLLLELRKTQSESSGPAP